MGIIDVIGALVMFWGAWLGVAIAALLTWVLSYMAWGEFNFELFAGLAIPFVIGGAFLQYQAEKRTK